VRPKQYLLITEVDYDKDECHIDKVKVVAVGHEKPKTAVITRENVITLIDKRYKFFTTEHDPDDYDMDVLDKTESSLTPVVKYADGFIRTKSNDKQEDNLGNLPSISYPLFETRLGFNEFKDWLDQYWK